MAPAVPFARTNPKRAGAPCAGLLSPQAGLLALGGRQRPGDVNVAGRLPIGIGPIVALTGSNLSITAARPRRNFTAFPFPEARQPADPEGFAAARGRGQLTDIILKCK